MGKNPSSVSLCNGKSGLQSPPHWPISCSDKTEEVVGRRMCLVGGTGNSGHLFWPLACWGDWLFERPACCLDLNYTLQEVAAG